MCENLAVFPPLKADKSSDHALGRYSSCMKEPFFKQAIRRQREADSSTLKSSSFPVANIFELYFSNLSLWRINWNEIENDVGEGTEGIYLERAFF